MTRYVLPPSMQKEIVAFDRNKTMEPGVYQLSRPSKNERIGARSRREKRKTRHGETGKTRRKVRFVHQTTGVRSLFEPATK